MYALWYFSPELKLMQTQVLALVISTRGSWNYDDDVTISKAQQTWYLEYTAEFWVMCYMKKTFDFNK